MLQRAAARDSMQTAYIGMGGNVASWAGAPEATLAAAALRLESLGRVVRRSSLYSTAPVGFAGQPRFGMPWWRWRRNLRRARCCIGCWPSNRIRARADGGLAERASYAGSGHFAFGDLTISEPELEIPHPRLAERAFVLVPLNEIAPQAVVPGLAKRCVSCSPYCRIDFNAVIPVKSVNRAYPNVNENACTPGARNSIRKTRSRAPLFCRIN